MIDNVNMSDLFRSYLALPMRARVETLLTGWRATSTAGEPEAQTLRYDLMQSTQYRFDSILFHLSLLTNVEAGHLETLRETSERSARREPLKAAVTQVRFVFDDIVMLIVILFDYFAGFATVFLVGPEHSAMKWAKLLEHARVDSPIKGKTERLRALGESRVARLALTENQSWLKGLASYRGSIVHDASPKLEGAVAHELVRDGAPSNEITLHVHTPAAFIEKVPGVPTAPDGGRAEIGGTAEWLIERAFLLARDLCLALEADLRGM